MTFNELTTIFASDDLNPNAELVFYVDSQYSTTIDDFDIVIDEYVIDDVFESDDYISIYLKER